MDVTRGNDQPLWPLLTKLTSSLLVEMPDLADRLARSIQVEIPYYRGENASSFAALTASARNHIEFLFNTEAVTESTYAAQIRLGDERARSGVPLPAMLEAIRWGSQFLWLKLVAHARAFQLATDTELVSLASDVWLLHDTFVRLTQEGYRIATERALVTEQQERFGLLHAIITGSDNRPETLWESVDRLGLPRQGGYYVAAVQVDSLGNSPAPRLEDRLARRHIESAWLLLSDVYLGIVNAYSARTLDVLRSELELLSVTAGISTRAADYAAVPRFARLARTALAAAPTGGVLAFEDSPVSVTIAGAPDVSHEAAVGVLGPMLELPEDDLAVLLETLGAWFDAAGSAARAATTLFVHANTVRNRLRRIESMTSRTLSHPRDAAELILALTSMGQAPAR